jgi:two-component system OmpR family response regulator
VVLTAGSIRLDTTSREAHCQDIFLPLGQRELSLLEVLIRRQGKVAPRAVLTEALYDRDMEVTPNAVDAAVSRPRRALADAGADVTLKTIRGVGWILTAGAP